MNSIKTKSIALEQIDALTAIIAKYLSAGDVVALNGDMGAGKTTLVSSIAKHLHLKSGQTVSSPTYVLHQIYEADFRMHHIDLYRLNSIEAVDALGFEEFLGIDGVVFIEWFANFPSIWTGRLLQIEIVILDLEHRQYIFKIDGKISDHLSKMCDEILKKYEPIHD